MPVSDLLQCIYIHIPKCGGKSVTACIKVADAGITYVGRATEEERRSLGVRSWWLHHLKARELRSALGASRWRRYTKFAFVRNPWDLMVSYYFYHKHEAANNPTFRKDWPLIAARFDEATTFARWMTSGIYVEPQVRYITDLDGTMLMNFVGKLEAFERDFSRLAALIGLPPAPVHLNRTDHCLYGTYYDTVTNRIVAQHFAEDIERFAYRF